VVGVQTKPNKGKFQLAINGANVGDIQDEYATNVGYQPRYLGVVTFGTAGNQDFMFTVVD
jgi:hypothetical protein